MTRRMTKTKAPSDRLELERKKVALAVTGGIAVYKACEVLRLLRKQGAEVRVAMTRSAREFVRELTFATLSEKPVLTSLFSKTDKPEVVHIDLARWCDLLLICPATANIMAKAAAGIADDVVSTTVLATSSPVIFCPAMNSVMWEKPVVQENLDRLEALGYTFVPPEWGALATESEGHGIGRLAAPQLILQKVKQTLLGSDELKGKKVLVTTGPTVEAIDPVRFISNHSSGRMGFALAEAACLKGADVVLISGPNHLDKLDAVKYIEVSSSEEMKAAVFKEYQGTDILLMAAAVADYKPKETLTRKLKKTTKTFSLQLQATTDILAELGNKKDDCVHVGFALETDRGVANATRKLHAKNLDMIVLNNPLEPGAAFIGETNVVTIITRDGEVEQLPKLPKTTVARLILEKVLELTRINYRHAAVV